MVDGFTLSEIFSASNTNLGILFVICLFVWRMWNSGPAMGETWILWQQTKAAKEVSDFNRLRGEIHRLSEAEQECRKNYNSLHRQFIDCENAHSKEIAALRAELGELRGLLAGQGQIRQLAAGVVAIERAEDKKPPEGK